MSGTELETNVPNLKSVAPLGRAVHLFRTDKRTKGVRQTPVYLGRKKRETDDEVDLSEGKTREHEAELQVAGQINILVDTEFDYDEMF